ncbi:MAG: MoxR family ATPase, partial [Nitrospirae bacterium]
RIQFTSDLLPSDITGVNVYNPETREFEFNQGPVFANIVLADEINRTNPKTQSALLEAMNERRVSIDRKTYPLPSPFMVIATQNPYEYHGTFPLPESQLDRFMLHLRIGYPDREIEKEVITRGEQIEDLETLPPVISKEEVLTLQEQAERIHMDESILEYIMKIIISTRRDERIHLGVSTRGGQFLVRASRALALYEGRDFVVPEDIIEVAPHVLGHRIILRSKTYIRDADEIIKDILEKTEVPV